MTDPLPWRSAQPPYLIAEIGVNHDGNEQKALDLVDAAHRAGAHAVKLQLFETDRLMSSASRLAAYQRDAGATDPFSMLRALELSIDQMAPVVERAQALGLHAIVTPFSPSLVEAAERIPWDAYKTSSTDIINKPLIDNLVATGKPLILSTGAATLDEIRRAAGWLGKARTRSAILHCVSSYPTADQDTSLGAITALRNADLGVDAIGYSDHTPRTDTGAFASSLGATILEKHLTLDRASPGPDHAASLDPDAFAEYARLCRDGAGEPPAELVGPAEKRVLPCEADVRTVSRQSLVLTQPVPRGQPIPRQALTTKRPGTGIEPFRIDEVTARTAARDLEPDRPLTEDDLA
ncbi:MAG: N-acetylneuraminate synthase family protein [Phycisphaerales bacterium JB065]